ncbi:MAG: fibronectin type III domain-containing protein, partial [Treponema sp.]|nr:fibronectin type III domain-containing protein [Treponema sp.]
NRVDMQNSGANSSLYSFVVPKTELEKLPPPNQIFVAAPKNDKIEINWSAVKGATSYRLERAVSAERDGKGNWIVPPGEDFELLEHSKSIYSTYFTDLIIDDSTANPLRQDNEAYGRAYFYRVAAENITSSVTAEDDSDYIMTGAATLLAPPPSVNASKGESPTSITVSWEKSSAQDIKNYEIWRSTNPDGSGSVRMTKVVGNATQWTDNDVQQGVDYYYTIYSLTAGGTSIQSSPAYGYVLQDGAPSRATNVHVTSGRGNTENAIIIEWNSASNATGYYIYRSSSKDSSSTRLARIEASSTTPTYTYTDTKSLKPNVYYYYEIQSFKTTGTSESQSEIIGPMSQSGKDSEIVQDTSGPAEGYIVSPPLEVNVVKILGDASQNIITFSAALGSESCLANSGIYSDYNNYTYKIYTCSTQNGTFTNAGTISPVPADEPGYFQAVVTAAKYYKMSTLNGSAESKQSDVVAPAPYAAANCQASDNAALGTSTIEDDDKKAANMNGVHAVRITWEAPSGGADGGYNIYRSTKENSGFKKINESPVSDLHYDDVNDSAKPGKLFYYRVLSLNSLGQGANYSNIDRGYGALTTYQFVREYIKTTLNSQKKLTLMHKSGNTAKLGTETAYGAISGTLSYDAHVSGVSGRVIMEYKNYADFYIMDDKNLGVYFLLNGNTNTSAGMDTNGTMDGTVTIQGMFPGKVRYDKIKISGGAAGGGTYGVWRENIDPNFVEADWLYGEK